MKKYKLLKDLPFAKAGTEWDIRKTPVGNFELTRWDNKRRVMWNFSWGDPRESDWFEEVKEDERCCDYYDIDGEVIIRPDKLICEKHAGMLVKPKERWRAEKDVRLNVPVEVSKAWHDAIVAYSKFKKTACCKCTCHNEPFN